MRLINTHVGLYTIDIKRFYKLGTAIEHISVIGL